MLRGLQPFWRERVEGSVEEGGIFEKDIVGAPMRGRVDVGAGGRDAGGLPKVVHHIKLRGRSLDQVVENCNAPIPVYQFEVIISHDFKFY